MEDTPHNTPEYQGLNRRVAELNTIGEAVSRDGRDKHGVPKKEAVDHLARMVEESRDLYARIAEMDRSAAMEQSARLFADSASLMKNITANDEVDPVAVANYQGILNDHAAYLQSLPDIHGFYYNPEKFNSPK